MQTSKHELDKKTENEKSYGHRQKEERKPRNRVKNVLNSFYFLPSVPELDSQSLTLVFRADYYTNAPSDHRRPSS